MVKYLAAYHFFDLTIFTNYHPIFFAILFTKIYKESCIFSSLFFLLNPSQSSFCPHLSTETALIKVSNGNHIAKSSGQCPVLILLHLSATFDPADYFSLPSPGISSQSLLLVHAPSSDLLMLEYSRAQSLALFFSPSTLIPLMTTFKHGFKDHLEALCCLPDLSLEFHSLRSN